MNIILCFISLSYKYSPTSLDAYVKMANAHDRLYTRLFNS